MSDYRNDIEKYLKGELTPAERNALERKALHDPFLAEALEGAEQIPAADFANDIASLNAKLTEQKRTIWLWPARIAAGLAILAVSSYIVWSVMQEDPVQDLALEKSESLPQPATPTDSVAPAAEGPVEQPTAGALSSGDEGSPKKLNKPSVAKQEQQPLASTNEKPAETEPVTLADVQAEEEKKADDLKATEAIAEVRPEQKEATLDKSKAEDDATERSRKSSASDKKKTAKDAAPAGAIDGRAGFVSQQRVVRGRVTSTEDGSPLPGVNVMVKGTTIGTATDAVGNYQITLTDTNPTIVYSFIGLQSTEVNVADRDEINVSMALDATQLSEVVVVGYGAQTGESLPPTVDLAHPVTGNRAFKQYLEQNIRYPETAKANGVEGRVTVEFTVEPDGTLTNFTVLRGIGSGCDEELIRLIREGPAWIPTKKDGVSVQDKAKVRLKFELPK